MYGYECYTSRIDGDGNGILTTDSSITPDYICRWSTTITIVGLPRRSYLNPGTSSSSIIRNNAGTITFYVQVVSNLTVASRGFIIDASKDSLSSQCFKLSLLLYHK